MRTGTSVRSGPDTEERKGEGRTVSKGHREKGEGQSADSGGVEGVAESRARS